MMDWLGQLYLSQGLWLLALPVPWLSWRLLRQRARQRLGRFIAPRLWPWVLRRERDGGQPYSRTFIVAWLLTILALSGPYHKGAPPAQQAVRGADIAVIVDISPSMNVRDVMPDRLQRARFELHDFLARLRGDRVALLAYSANAYRLLPLTNDYPTVRHFIDALDTRLTRQHGSNLTQALEIASQLLASSKAGSRAIVLVSDGETHDRGSVLQAGTRLASQGIPVYALGIGTAAGGPVYDARGQFLRHEGNTVISRLDSSLLAGLAQRSGGLYTTLHGDDSDWNMLFTGIQGLARDNPYPEARRQGDQALFPWILAAGLLLFLWWGAQRVSGATVMVMILVLPALPQRAQAAPWQEQQAYGALRDGDYARAATLYDTLQGYRGALGRGAAAYRLQQWPQAVAAFEEARRLAASDRERARAAYNLGNALARQGRLDEAARAYREALQWQGNYPRATLNLNLVNQARKRQSLALRRAPTPGQSDTQGQRSAGQEYRHDGSRLQADAQRQGQPAGTAPPPSTSAAAADDNQTLRDFLTSPGADQAGMLVRLRIGEQDARYGRTLVEKPW